MLRYKNSDLLFSVCNLLVATLAGISVGLALSQKFDQIWIKTLQIDGILTMSITVLLNIIRTVVLNTINIATNNRVPEITQGSVIITIFGALIYEFKRHSVMSKIYDCKNNFVGHSEALLLNNAAENRNKMDTTVTAYIAKQGQDDSTIYAESYDSYNKDKQPNSTFGAVISSCVWILAVVVELATVLSAVIIPKVIPVPTDVVTDLVKTDHYDYKNNTGKQLIWDDTTMLPNNASWNDTLNIIDSNNRAVSDAFKFNGNIAISPQYGTTLDPSSVSVYFNDRITKPKLYNMAIFDYELGHPVVVEFYDEVSRGRERLVSDVYLKNQKTDVEFKTDYGITYLNFINNHTYIVSVDQNGELYSITTREGSYYNYMFYDEYEKKGGNVTSKMASEIRDQLELESSIYSGGDVDFKLGENPKSNFSGSDYEDLFAFKGFLNNYCLTTLDTRTNVFVIYNDKKASSIGLNIKTVVKEDYKLGFELKCFAIILKAKVTEYRFKRGNYTQQHVSITSIKPLLMGKGGVDEALTAIRNHPELKNIYCSRYEEKVLVYYGIKAKLSLVSALLVGLVLCYIFNTYRLFETNYASANEMMREVLLDGKCYVNWFNLGERHVLVSGSYYNENSKLNHYGVMIKNGKYIAAVDGTGWGSRKTLIKKENKKRNQSGKVLNSY